MKKIAIVNLCGSQFTSQDAQLFAQGGMLIATKAALDLKVEVPLIVVADSVGVIPLDCDGISIIAPTSTEAGAAGFHELYKDGRPVSYTFLDAAAGIFYDATGAGDSLFGIFIHELLEMMLDETANLFIYGPWRATKTGKLYTLRALEACDPVQGVGSTIVLTDGTKADRPGWIIPRAYFDTTGRKFDRYDSEGALTEPGQIAPQGYQIAGLISAERDVFAHVVSGASGIGEFALTRKKAKHSRTMLRLGNLVAHLNAPAASVVWV